MRRLAAILAAALMFGSAPALARGAGKPQNMRVFRVDSVSAEVTGRKLTIRASGAVRSGGWENPHLHVLRQHKPEGDTLEVEFLAAPPAKGSAVIQALLPVSATVTVGLPRYATTRVMVKAETNAATAEITRKH